MKISSDINAVDSTSSLTTNTTSKEGNNFAIKDGAVVFHGAVNEILGEDLNKDIFTVSSDLAKELYSLVLKDCDGPREIKGAYYGEGFEIFIEGIQEKATVIFEQSFNYVPKKESDYDEATFSVVLDTVFGKMQYIPVCEASPEVSEQLVGGVYCSGKNLRSAGYFLQKYLVDTFENNNPLKGTVEELFQLGSGDKIIIPKDSTVYVKTPYNPNGLSPLLGSPRGQRTRDYLKELPLIKKNNHYVQEILFGDKPLFLITQARKAETYPGTYIIDPSVVNYVRKYTVGDAIPDESVGSVYKNKYWFSNKVSQKMGWFQSGDIDTCPEYEAIIAYLQSINWKDTNPKFKNEKDA